MTHRIKSGSNILKTFIEIGSDKEINISYGVRKIILSIVRLAKQMNDNKEKYGDLLAHTRNNSASILNSKDIQFINSKNSKDLRVDITKQLTFELEDILNASGSNLSADDVIYSMGFTESLFDAAYDEIFSLMLAKWIPFKNQILSYLGDSNIIKQHRQFDAEKKKEQRLTLNMVRAVNSISKSRKKHMVQKATDFNDILKKMNQTTLSPDKFEKNVRFRKEPKTLQSPCLQLASMEDMDDDDSDGDDFDKNYDGFYDDEEEESESVHNMKGHHVYPNDTR